jgi:hypothetical protein
MSKIPPDTGINQRDLISKIKTNLVDISNKKAQELLNAGLTSHWSVEKPGKNNALIYKPFFGFPWCLCALWIYKSLS